MALLNERGARISPATREPYAAAFGAASLPTADDPGWGDWRHKDSGAILRMIRIHGPFDVVGADGIETHCQDGWLVTGAASGRVYAVLAADHAAQFEALS